MRRKNNNLGHSHSLFSFQKQSKPINFGDYPHSCQLSLRNQNKSKESAQLFNHFKKPRIQRAALEGMKLRNFTINRLLFAPKLAKKREKGNKVTPSEGFSSERDSIKALLHLHQDPKIIFFSTKNQENKGEKRTSLNSCTRKKRLEEWKLQFDTPIYYKNKNPYGNRRLGDKGNFQSRSTFSPSEPTMHSEPTASFAKREFEHI